MTIKIDAWKLWGRIWEKSMKMASSYNNWKSPNSKGSVQTFSRRKTELHNEFIKILKEIETKLTQKTGSDDGGKK